MGHERLPFLPKTEKWRQIVDDISRISVEEVHVEEIIKRTAKAIDRDFRELYRNQSVQDAFSFIINLSIAAKTDSIIDTLIDFGFEIEGDKLTPLFLSKSLSKYLRKSDQSTEIREIAKAAASKALAQYYKTSTNQLNLFPNQNESFQVWREISRAAGFCEISRLFFSNLTTNYFKYFLDREASAVLPNFEARYRFNYSIESHIERIVRHSFEVSKITQPFAAGWYNINIKNTDTPYTRRKSIKFLYIAINKIRDSLNRETSD